MPSRAYCRCWARTELGERCGEVEYALREGLTVPASQLDTLQLALQECLDDYRRELEQES